jgi:hypothetical protein
MLIQACDLKLIEMLPDVQGYRFIDDYELAFKTRTEAENAFHILEKILADFELALNPRKTSVIELPFQLESPWVAPLRSFKIRTTPGGQATDLIAYCDLACELNKKFADEAVLQFAVGRFRSLEVAQQNWRLFQRLLLSIAVPEPATLPFVLLAILSRVNSGSTPEVDEIGRALNTIIIEHSRIGHSSEVSWALWACLALNIQLSSVATETVAQCDDSCVALLALHCQSVGLTANPLNTTLWSSYMTSQALYEEQWLLAYEANLKGWLPSADGGDHVLADPNFAFLKSSGVSFYNISGAISSAQSTSIPLPQPSPPATDDGFSDWGNERETHDYFD